MFMFPLCDMISGSQESITYSRSDSEPPDGYFAQIQTLSLQNQKWFDQFELNKNSDRTKSFRK